MCPYCPYYKEKYEISKAEKIGNSIVKEIKLHAKNWILKSEELQGKYGERIRSRMREMFNLISFNTHSRDKRK